MIEIPPISLRGASSKESKVGDQRSPEGFAQKSGLSVPEGQVLIANLESEARNEDSSRSFMSWQSTIHNTQWEISCIRLRSALCSLPGCRLGRSTRRRLRGWAIWRPLLLRLMRHVWRRFAKDYVS